MLGHRKLALEDYLSILKRRFWLLLACVIIFPAIAITATFFMQPRYLSQTLVLIEEQRVPGEYVTPVISSSIDSRLASMKEQILSRSRIAPIIERYNLFANTHASVDDRVDMTRKGIEIKPVRSAITNAGGLPGFYISFTANDAHTAQLVCSEITSLFLNQNIQDREKTTEGTTNFLKTQLADAKRSLDEQDAKLADFQRQYVGKLPGQQTPNIGMLTSLNTQLEASNQTIARMEQDKTYMQSLLNSQLSPDSQKAGVSLTPGGPIVPQGNGSAQQQAEMTVLTQEETQLLSQYTPEHPDVVAIRRKIAELQRKMEKPAATTAAGGGPAKPVESIAVQQLRAQIQAADVGIAAKRKEQAQIQGAVGTYQERISSSPLVEEQYKELTRDYDTSLKAYNDLLTNMQHAKMATDLERQQEGEQFRIMDEANLPESPTFPNRLYFGGIGFAFGLGLALLISGFLEYKDTALRSERDVWAFTKLPTLAVISVAGDVVPEKDSGLLARWKQRSEDKKLRKASLAGANG